MKRYNIVYSAVIIAIGVFAGWYALRYNLSDPRFRIGAGAFPVMMAVCLVIAGFVILIGALRGIVVPGEETMEPIGLSRLGVFIAAFAAYFALLQPLGFLVDSVLMVAFCMHRLGCREGRAMAAYSILMPSAIFVIFYYCMYVTLPLGILEPIIPKY